MIFLIIYTQKYSNILTSIAENSKRLDELGDSKKILDYIDDLESIFKEEIIIGGSKVQATITPPDWLNEEFSINTSEVDFISSKTEESKQENPEEVKQPPKSSVEKTQESLATEAPLTQPSDKDKVEDSDE